MKTLLMTGLIAVVVVFVAVTLVKDRPAQESLQMEQLEERDAEKERIMRFWESYRAATEHRIAGRLKEAAESYRGALALKDDHEDALYYFGNVSLELDDFAQAERSLRRLIQINPHSARAHSRLGDLYLTFDRLEFFDIEKAETEYRKALAINKEETGPSLRLGQVALIRGDLTKADQLFDLVLGSNYRSVEAHFLKGYISWKMGRVTEAEKLLAKASEFSRPLKSTHGVAGEGDTKSDMPNFERHALFHAFTLDLSELNKDRIAEEVDKRYQKLDNFLGAVRRKS